MTRFIDADKLHKAIDKETYRHTYIEQIHSIIDNAPTIESLSADVVEVVRCKNCVHYESDGGALMQCGVSGITVNDEDYCSMGERKEE